MKTLKALAVAAILPWLMALHLSAAEVEVEAEGKAVASAANAREQALADALREAVRQGAGTDIVSSTSVRNFTLDYDRIFASAFGYVRNYAVLGSRLGEDGLYRVKVRATVGAGLPGRRDDLVLRQLMQLKKSPRVALEISELIENVPAGSDFAKSWFESAARSLQMNLVDVKRVTAQSDRLAARDELFGDRRAAEIRRADLAQKADFIIEVKVRGRHLGPKTINSIPGHEFSLNVDLRAVVPETGQIIGAVPLAGQELWKDQADAGTVARTLVHGLLEGVPERAAEYPGAWAIFRKIVVAWMTEVDLGELKRLEFAQITDAEFDSVQKALGQESKINAVLDREFDSKSFSFVDVETRLDPTGLKSVALAALGPVWQYDHGTRAYLQFTRAAAPQGGVSGGAVREAPGAAAGTAAVGSAGAPAWIWALGGAGLMAVIFGAFLLGKKSKG